MGKGAGYRQIHTHIWEDNWFVDLEPKAKLLFIWLFSNNRTSVSGLYEISIPVASFQTGLSRDEITDIFLQFEKAGKMMWLAGWIWVKNLRKYNDSHTPNAYKRIMADVNCLPAGELKDAYLSYYQQEHDRYLADRQAIANQQGTLPQPFPNPSPTPPQPIQEQRTENIEHRTLNIEHLIPINQSTTEIAQMQTETQAEEQPALAQAPRPPAHEPSPGVKTRKNPPDERLKHPAILLYHGVTRLYPPKSNFDAVISILGEHPDGTKAAECYQAWTFRGYKPVNLGWLEWYRDGIPPSGPPGKNNGHGPPVPTQTLYDARGNPIEV